MDKLKNPYISSIIGSVIVHSILIIFLLFSISTTVQMNSLPKSNGEIVQAVVVDQKMVEDEVKRLETIQYQQKKAQDDQQKQIADKLLQVKQEKAKTEAKLEKIKQDILKAKQVEEANLAQLKLAKEKEKKELEALKQEKVKKKNEMEALDDARSEEQERVKQMRLEREKEESKKHAAKQSDKDALVSNAQNQRKIQTEYERIIQLWGSKIKSNKRLMSSASPDLTCVFKLIVLPDGNAVHEIVQSSGNPAFDSEMVKAILKSQPFEISDNQDVRNRLREGIEFSFKNNEEF